MGSSQPASVHLNKLIDPDVWHNHCHSHLEPRQYERENDPPPYTSDVSTIIRSQTHATFWASSPRPHPTISDFALATSYGTVIVAEAQSSWSLDRIQTFNREDIDASAEVLAVDWLDTNVVLNGCRDGTVRLWDTRTCGASGTSWRLRHRSCVNHVRRLDGHRIVVAGLEGRMAVYDLRDSRAVKDGYGDGATRAWVEFPGYGNREVNGVAVGFDVLGNLVAAGMDEGGWRVFDAGSGREVRVGGGGDGGRGLRGPARCLRFVDEEGDREGRRLFVGDVGGIEEWRW